MASAVRKALGPIVKRLADAQNEAKRLIELPDDQQAANISAIRLTKEKLLKYNDTYQRKYSEWLSFATNDADELAKVNDDIANHSTWTMNSDEAIALLTSIIDNVQRREQQAKADTEVQRREQYWANLAPPQGSAVNAPPVVQAQPPPPPPPPTATIKLPKMELEPFDGEILNWTRFWDRFRVSVHQNNSISAVEKMVYLTSFLTGRAHQAIAGLAVTADNYPGAIDILKKRFGNENTIINAQYTALTNLAPATGNNSKLRETVDKLEQYLNSLTALGEDIENRLVLTTLKAKIPVGVIIRLQELNGDEFTDVASLREALQRFLINREEAEIGRTSPTPDKRVQSNQPRYKPPISTTNSLIGTNASGTSNRKCVFCQRTSHWSDECQTFPTIDSRRQKVGNNCPRCLRSGHGLSGCQRTKPCFHCRGTNHHQSLCPQKFPAANVNAIIASVISTPEIKSNDGNPNPNENSASNTSSLLVSGESVLLQTATSEVRSLDGKNKLETRIVFDSCSHRTYITEKLAKQLKLVSLGKENISVGTFGSASHKTMATKVVEIQLKLRPDARSPNGSFFTIRANVVPVITGGINRAPVDFSKYKPMYGDLPFADAMPTEHETINPELLIGNNHYWELITAERIILGDGLFLIGSKLGWLLTGRHQSARQRNLPPWIACSQTLMACELGYCDESESDESESEDFNHMTATVVPTPQLTMLSPVSSAEQILPQIASVMVQSPSGHKSEQVRILFDTGCTSTFISASLAKSLELPITSTTSNTIFTFGAYISQKVSNNVVPLRIRQVDGNTFPLTANVIQTIAPPFPLPGCDIISLLEDSSFNGPLANLISPVPDLTIIDMVIGCDVYWDLINSERIDLPCGLRLIGSKFGYIACGRYQQPCTTPYQLGLLAIKQAAAPNEQVRLSPEESPPDHSVPEQVWKHSKRKSSSLQPGPGSFLKWNKYVFPIFLLLGWCLIKPVSTIQPMICDSEEAKVVLDLSITTSCPIAQSSGPKDIHTGTVMLFKRNIAKYESTAYRCNKVKTTYKAWTNFAKAGWDTRISTSEVGVTDDDCRNMVKFHRCSEGPLFGSDTLAYTENQGEYPYTSGNAWDCCKWMTTETINCFLTKGKVYETFGAIMESNLGNVASCDYDKKSCILHDQSVLIWETAQKASCEFVEWRSFPGTYWNGHFLSDDREIALTWDPNQERTIELCEGARGRITDQGIPIVTSLARSKRFAQRADVEREYNRIKKTEQTDLTAARLQAIEEGLDELRIEILNTAFGQVCRSMRKMQQVDLIHSHSQPTLMARYLLNEHHIMARLTGKLLEVWPCLPVDSFQTTPMGTKCTDWIPINATVKGKAIFGYLDPKTNIIFQNSAPAKCKLVQEVHLQDTNGAPWIYTAKNGEVKPMKGSGLPHPLYNDNITLYFNFSKVIHKSMDMYPMDEIRGQPSLNDVFEALDQHRKTLNKLADIANEIPHDHQASNIMDNLNRYTPWGMLTMFGSRLRDYWVSFICAYISFQILWRIILRRVLLSQIMPLLRRSISKTNQHSDVAPTTSPAGHLSNAVELTTPARQLFNQ